MALHLQKLSVGTTSIDGLADWQRRLAAHRGEQGRAALPDHVTRMFPKRAEELLDGGSVYWVIKGLMLCRSEIVGLEETVKHGNKACRIVLRPGLIPVMPTPRRAFQGWRYLTDEDAPKDISVAAEPDDLPPALRRKLVEIGLW
jgi:hypothetical protein